MFENRKQSSYVYISKNNHVIYVDMGINPYPYVKLYPEAVFLTHWHSDHSAGLFSARWMEPGFDLYAPCSGELFEFFRNNPKNMKMHCIKHTDSIKIGDFEIRTVELQHGNIKTCGYIISDGLNNVAHISDTYFLPEKTLDIMKKQCIDAIILDVTYIGSMVGGKKIQTITRLMNYCGLLMSFQNQKYT